MRTHTIQTVLINTLIAISLGGSGLFAKDVPIVESLSLGMSTDRAVVEFPFKIASISPEFIPEKGSFASAPEIKKGENVLEITSASPGELKTIIWGYEHPIFLNIKFEKNGERYYKFTDPIGKNSDIKAMESNAHEDVVADLIVAAFSEKIPKGFVSRSRKITGESAGVKWTQQIEYVGSDYLVQSWKIVNEAKEDIELYEEMFASEQNKIYGISIESPRLKPGEATRLFIVKKTE